MNKIINVFDIFDMQAGFKKVFIFAIILVLTVSIGAADSAENGKLNVCATITDLGDIVSNIGGSAVNVTVFAKATEDPHFVEAKPGFIKSLSGADMLVISGMELETGWLPVLINNCRNAKIQNSGSGYVDCSKVIEPLDVPAAAIDRSMGDVHPNGNPHYLLDPVNGAKAAELIKEKLCELQPSQKKAFEENYAAFMKKLGAAVFGAELAGKYDFIKLVKLNENGKLLDFLKSQKDDSKLGGCIGKLLPYSATKIVDDHAMWIYFANRFGFVIMGHMEEVPGVPPTTKTIRLLSEKMKTQGI
ncbi:MAG TPA: metal ABC transporter substrate-binding protein, partial [Candidatus Wallbacteria bacterium]|nr:metal ABC transporter substrate-binding protein [Candidatus Wallbacteria bacterium]